VTLDHPSLARPLMYTFGFLFVLVTLRTMLSGLTKHRFNPFRRTLLVSSSVLLSLIAWVHHFNYGLFDAPTVSPVLWGLAALSAGSVLHMAVNVLAEIRDIIGIQILTITTPKA